MHLKFRAVLVSNKTEPDRGRPSAWLARAGGSPAAPPRPRVISGASSRQRYDGQRLWQALKALMQRPRAAPLSASSMQASRSSLHLSKHASRVGDGEDDPPADSLNQGCLSTRRVHCSMSAGTGPPSERRSAIKAARSRIPFGVSHSRSQWLCAGVIPIGQLPHAAFSANARLRALYGRTSRPKRLLFPGLPQGRQPARTEYLSHVGPPAGCGCPPITSGSGARSRCAVPISISRRARADVVS